MRILMTGGAGYVGSACLRWALQNGHDPVAFDNLSMGNAAAVPGERLVLGDIEDRGALVQAMREWEIEAVMHFAALASVPESIQLVFSSTAATYAFDNAMPLIESSRLDPQVPYGRSKLAAEWMIRDYTRAYGLSHVILRYFNASGADPDGQFGEDRRDETHLIPLVFYAAIGRRDELLIYGDDWETRDGTCVRDYVHTEDLARAHQVAIEKMEPGSGRTFNVGSGRGATVREVLRACEEVVGHPIPHAITERRPGDPAVLIASSERLMRELGWKPRFTDIRDIVATAWAWCQSHPDGYGSRA
jgi:UDP-glucose 4-epimerase